MTKPSSTPIVECVFLGTILDTNFWIIQISWGTGTIPVTWTEKNECKVVIN